MLLSVGKYLEQDLNIPQVLPDNFLQIHSNFNFASKKYALSVNYSSHYQAVITKVNLLSYASQG